MARSRDWDWRNVQDTKQRLGQLLDEAWEKFDLYQRLREGGCWQPVTDAYETPEAYIIQMELAGLTKEEVGVEVRQFELTIYGQRQPERNGACCSHQVLERFRGPFARRFQLPQETDPQAISARMENGLLIVTVPKSGSRQQKRRIEVIEE
ncbi:MAG: Hsp20/alpha crystallin family protein [Desulfohalobiaceae bacterium]|nr:Hsp20/alpha crystallin family protein [Desulfohalobiaceae bacterium]